VGTYDGSTLRVYVNGALDNTLARTGAIGYSSLPLTMGYTQAPGQWFAGAIDEVRVSNSARPAGWVTTEYNNQNAPATFLSVGTQQ